LGGTKIACYDHATAQAHKVRPIPPLHCRSPSQLLLGREKNRISQAIGQAVAVGNSQGGGGTLVHDQRALELRCHASDGKNRRAVLIRKEKMSWRMSQGPISKGGSCNEVRERRGLVSGRQSSAGEFSSRKGLRGRRRDVRTLGS